eukprot:COSAG01_NODE_636_length_14635_cov_18.612617_11_plen_77_part_00
MNIINIILTITVLAFCFLGFGMGVLFFGKAAERNKCGSVPTLKTEACPSQKAGLCPIEDKSGYLKMATQGRLNFPK